MIKGLIVAAGCFLPLTKNIDVERDYGTRHRAAIGVTENFDAIAIVVSEENNNVSIAVSGQLIPIDDSFSLRRYLTFLWGTGNQIKDILPRSYGEVESE